LEANVVPERMLSMSQTSLKKIANIKARLVENTPVHCAQEKELLKVALRLAANRNLLHRLFMIEPRIVDVAYADGRWLAEVQPDYHEPLDCVSFQQIIDTAQRDWPDQKLIFVVDRRRGRRRRSANL
jgi:hypothetical protein